jgi:hypothetical protein
VAVKAIKLALKAPFIEVSGTWEPTDLERRAAWELYVQLVTRIAVAPLPRGEGLDREALASLHQLFGIHREVLSRYGPDLAKPKPRGQYSLGILAVTALNYIIRPFLARWHPELTDYEAQRPPDRGAADHERQWAQHEQFRQELDRVRGNLQTYAEWLSHACGVPDLISVAPTLAQNP